MSQKFLNEKNCGACYRTSPNINNKDCYWNWEECQGEHFRKYDPEKCTLCESENEKPDPWGYVPCHRCGWGGNWDNYQPKQNWVSISQMCPKCHKYTVLSNGDIWKCGCGFVYRLNYSGYSLLQSESFIESAKSEPGDYQFENENICDEIYYLQEAIRKNEFGEWESNDLIKRLTQMISMLEFRLKSKHNLKLQRFCISCHNVLVERKNRYFYCNNKTCVISKEPQRGVEKEWRFKWEINPSQYPIVEYGNYDIWRKIINSLIYKNISKILNWRNYLE